MVATAPLLAAFGEAIKITPVSTGVAVDTHGIIGRTPILTPEGDEKYYATWLDLPSVPAYVNGDAVVYRGISALITTVTTGADVGWIRYWLAENA